MIRATALACLLAAAAGARADSSAPAAGDAAAKRRSGSWSAQCKERFERARADSARIVPALRAAKIGISVREEVLPLVETVAFEYGAWHVTVERQSDDEFERARPWSFTGPPKHTAEWQSFSEPNNAGWTTRFRRVGGYTAVITDFAPGTHAQIEALQALWRRAT